MMAIAKRGLVLVGLFVVLLACKMLDKKQEGAPSATPSAAAAPTPTAAASGAENKPKTDLSGPKDAKGVDLAKILGTKADLWSLPPFAKLKEDMTPAECDKVIPGSAKIDAYGFVEIKPNVKGVAAYKLSFQDADGKKGLKFVTILFDPTLTDEPFWNALVDHLKQRLPAEMTDHGGHHVQWVSSSLLSWSLSKGITHDGYEIETAIDK